MADNFILDWTPGLNAAVLTYNAHERRYELTLVDTSTQLGELKFALLKTGRFRVWVWQPIDWHSGPVH
jgi:hypothetical protein